ncbi:hypothetical protein MTR67_020771 [Solanum verrucosum]|uniref:Reverse transcriptase domain-containing protein n=1 Tax=Solanum verrucosum TaxID=315347 RepID=A0AAF0QVK4_SOLVR|nr:hypothetical protein MTR67_020771 [Solanum verrucosum]
MNLSPRGSQNTRGDNFNRGGRGGDFNVILAPEEKQGVTHLIRIGSDHWPLLISISSSHQTHQKYFRFLDLWTQEPGFNETLKAAWNEDTSGSPMWNFHLKLKNTCRKLSQWSRNSVGNIFDNTKAMEKKVADLEEICLTNNSDSNRMAYNCANAQLIMHIKKEEAFWKQKAGMKWFQDGDSNTKFFHTIMNNKRRRLVLKKIKKNDNTWIEGSDEIAKEAINFFESQFSKDDSHKDFSILNCLPCVINEEDNNIPDALPTMTELKEAVFSLSADSAPGPDGLTGTFYQKCWDIISIDLFNMIDMIWRLLANNWYSININGSRHGFFKSGRGIKQGDPLSPSLFIIGAELLTKLMEQLISESFIPYSVDKGCPSFTHLSYADDTILFSSGDPLSLMAMMNKLSVYEKCSGQLINKDKSCFLVAPNTHESLTYDIKRITGFSQSNFPFTYLGCPIYFGRQRVKYFDGLISKITGRLQGWQGKMISCGGRAVLIKAVLQSLPLHMLSVIHLPKTTTSQIEKLFANFFWSETEGKKKHHWIAWKNLCYPTDEGGIGIKSIQDINNSFSAKVWWSFRTRNTLWRNFLEAKYCPRAHPVKKKWVSGQSHTWKRILHVRSDCEKYLVWKIVKENCSFWWDNWLGTGNLGQHFPHTRRSKKLKVANFMIGNTWDENKLLRILPMDMVKQIQNINIYEGEDDFPIWTPDTHGFFTCKSSWKVLREGRNMSRPEPTPWAGPAPGDHF